MILCLLLRDRINDSFFLVIAVCFDVCVCFLNIIGDIKGVSWCFRNGNAVIEREHCWYGSKSDNDPPGSIASNLAGVVATREVLRSG